MGTVLIPIPDRDFDPTEVAVSWRVLTRDGHRVVFATESGTPGVADDIMVTGRGLDVWSAIPIVGRATFIGRFLRANKDARALDRLLPRRCRFARAQVAQREHVFDDELLPEASLRKLLLLLE